MCALTGNLHHRHAEEILNEFKDGDEKWVPLKLLKETNPIEVAEYVTAQGIESELAFDWWVPYTLRKRDQVVAAVNSRV